MSISLFAALAAAATGGNTLIVGKLGTAEASLVQGLHDLGVVSRMPNREGLVKITSQMPLPSLRAELKKRGVTHMFEGSAEEVDPTSLPSVKRHMAYLRGWASLTGKDGEEAGVDFYEALEYYLEPRVDQFGHLDAEAYRRAIRQREAMPKARPEWFGGGGAGIASPTGSWLYVGPMDLNAPYQQYYGVRSLSGRKNDVAYAPSNPSIIYAASAGGGCWKTVDGGTNWTSQSDTWPYLHTSSVAVHPTDPNTVYVGTGDYYGFFGVQSFGIMKSTDGGATWTNVGNADFGTKIVSKIVICPENPNIVLACTGRGSGPAGDIWRSTDGGTTWARTNATDGSWDDIDISGTPPSGGNRRIWAVGGGGTARLAYSTDLGATWTAAALPATVPSTASILNLAASKFDTDGVYLLAATSSLIFKSLDGAATWTNISAGIASGNWSQTSYNEHITCGKNAGTDVLYVGLISVSASDDGGATWADIAGTYTASAKWHNDQHCMAVHPTTDNVGIVGGDGGLARVSYAPATNVGTFTMLNRTIFDTQMYAMSVHPTTGGRMIGGTQDNASPAAYGNLSLWENLYAGDGGFSAYDLTNPAKHYSTSQSGGIYRYDTDNDLTPTSISLSGAPFVTPLAVAGPGYSTVFSSASTFLYRNAGGTSGWTASTTNIGGAARSIQNSKLDSNRIFAVRSNGDIWLSTDGGVTLTEKSTTLPNNSIGDIAEHPFTGFDVIVGLQHTSSATGRLFRCTDISAAAPVWTNISGAGVTGLPSVPVNTVIRDPRHGTYYYAGTDVGCFMTVDSGAHWYNMNSLGLPNVHVNDLWISNGWMYAATFGRGIWRINVQRRE